MNRPPDFNYVESKSDLQYIYKVTRAWRDELATMECQSLAPWSILNAGEIPITNCGVSEKSFNLKRTPRYKKVPIL